MGCISSILKHPNELLEWLSTGEIEVTPESIVGYIVYELNMNEYPEEEKTRLIQKIHSDAKSNLAIQEYSEKFIELIEGEFK